MAYWEYGESAPEIFLIVRNPASAKGRYGNEHALKYIQQTLVGETILPTAFARHAGVSRE